MNHKEEFYKNKITDLCNSYKVVATLSMLALSEKNVKCVIKLHNDLNAIFGKIIEFIALLNDEELLSKVKNLEVSELPEYLSSIKTIFSYNMMLSLKYAQTEVESVEEKILLNKLSIDFNYKEEIPYLNIAKLLFEEKHYAEALELCEFIKTITETAPVWNISGDVYRALKRYGKCIEAYKTYLDLNEDDDEVAEKLLQVYEEALN
ncbi:MAG: hypothetical protein NC200_08105 [Candidatus Gastranaerophilales bacterium]|nr:hypothetical protein [Candidatus Gastranaerophilales bacterium]